MQDFRTLEVWKKAHKLTLAIYEATKGMPREEIFGVTMQLRRSAVGIAIRIASGAGRENGVEMASDMHKAVSMASELEYTILLAGDLSYFQKERVERLSADTVEVRKMLFGLIRAI